MTEAEENIYFKVESFVKIWFRCFVEDIRLPVVLLEVAAPRVGIEEIDQGVGVLAPLTVQVLIVRQRNVNIILADFDLRTLAESM